MKEWVHSAVVVLLLGWSGNAVTQEAVPASNHDALITTCLSLAGAVQAILNGEVPVSSVQLHMNDIVLELSKPLPQSYNAVKAGIVEAVIQYNSANPHHPAKASTATRAAVFGLWCINDVVATYNPSVSLALQDAELQQTLVDRFEQVLNQQH